MHIGRDCVGMDHQARRAGIAGLGVMNHVAGPVRAALGAEPSLYIEQLAKSR
jgi:hypothetical protein